MASQPSDRPPAWWLFGTGENAEAWGLFQEARCVAHRASGLGDLTVFKTQLEVEAAMRALRGPGGPDPLNDARGSWAWMHGMEIGDFVIAKQGRRRVLGVGTILSAPKFLPQEASDYKHRRDVGWHWTGDLRLPESEPDLPITTLNSLSDRPAVVAFAQSLLPPRALPGAVPGSDWTDEEIRPTVAVYLDMLARQLRGQHFVKAQERRALEARLPGRTSTAIEYKFQNISAVLAELELPYIQGYLPATKYQQRLAEVVAEMVGIEGSGIPTVLSAMEAPTVDWRGQPIPALQEILEPPPEAIADPGVGTSKTTTSVARARIDGAMRDHANRKLGKQGEQFVLAVERQALIRAGRPDLAAQVRWVADLDGDGAGYDIRSFEPTGAKRLIEVKTTNCGKDYPFYVTANEVAASAAHAGSYKLYRLFGFAGDRRLYIREGDLKGWVRLEPTVFRAHVR